MVAIAIAAIASSILVSATSAYWLLYQATDSRYYLMMMWGLSGP